MTIPKNKMMMVMMMMMMMTHMLSESACLAARKSSDSETFFPWVWISPLLMIDKIKIKMMMMMMMMIVTMIVMVTMKKTYLRHYEGNGSHECTDDALMMC